MVGNPKIFSPDNPRSINRFHVIGPPVSPRRCLSLFHRIFGEFVDDAENYVPTPDDVPFFLAFVEAMANVYKLEDGRQDTVLDIFEKHKMYIKPTSIGKFGTDGDLSSGKFRFLIFEFEIEIGAGGAEPFFQAILYYLEATRKFAGRHSNSVLPCIIILIFGVLPFLDPSFILSYTLQALTSHLPVLHDGPIVRPNRCCPLPSHAIIYYQDTDIKMESMLVRHVGALQRRRAMHSLDTYYQEYRANPFLPLRNPTHPYPTSFISRDGSVQHFTYLFHMTGRNLFFGNADDTAICIRFVSRYLQRKSRVSSCESYVTLFNFLRDNPILSSEEHLGSRKLLSEKVGQCLRQLHRAGFVHGDIHDTNLMVKAPNRDGFIDWSFLEVVYDSCGKMKQVRYSLDLNTKSVWRPDGTTGGTIIEPGNVGSYLGSLAGSYIVVDFLLYLHLFGYSL
jgi:hypothetical protein